MLLDRQPDEVDSRVFVCDSVELHKEAHTPQVVRLIVVLRAGPQQDALKREREY